MGSAAVWIAPLAVGLALGGAVAWILLRGKLALAESIGRTAGEVERAGQAEQLRAAQQTLARFESQAAEHEARASGLRGELDHARQDCATLTERVSRLPELESAAKELSTALEVLREERLGSGRRMAELETALEKERVQSMEKLELLQGAREELSNQFKALANDILDDKSRKFTQQNQEKLGELLNPLGENIRRFEEMVGKAYGSERDQRTTLLEQVRQLTELNSALSQETQNLTLALKGDNKAQGNWGEILLDDVLTRAGLVEGQHYVRQGGVRSEDGRTIVIPDVVVRLPNERHLVVDSKFTLPDYRIFASTEDDGERAAALKRHLVSIRAHIKGLAEKNYQTLHGLRSLDFVVMFVPLEPAFMLAVTHDNELFHFAWDKNVLLVSPSTLLFVVRTVAFLWRQEDLARNAMDISKRGAELYDKLVGFVNDLQAVGDRMQSAQDAFQEARKKLSEGRGNVIRQAEMLKELGVKPTKCLARGWVEPARDDLDRDSLNASSRTDGSS